MVGLIILEPNPVWNQLTGGNKQRQVGWKILFFIFWWQNDM